MSKNIFLNAINRVDQNTPAVGPGTSIVSLELMEKLNSYFPEAHLNSEKMALLAEAGHSIYGFDVVMPLFSVWHESAALGCEVDWGKKNIMPDCRKPLFGNDSEIKISDNFLSHSACQVPLQAIEILKKKLNGNAAVCGKVFGPWTLGYHVFGTENFLISTMTDPDMIKRSLAKLKQVTIDFAAAQIEAGVDCILLGDHATRDLCSPESYKIFLQEIHAELADKINCPLILHICGDTADRISMISETGLGCFHWDTKLGSPEKARSLAGEKLALMGGVNTEILRTGKEEDIINAVECAFEAGIDIAPECAVPLDTPMKNLKVLGDAVRRKRG